MKIHKWQDLEQAVQTTLATEQKRKPLVWHRFFDTKSAGNFMPNQPGDFYAGYLGKGWLIECKFSGIHESLRQCFSSAMEAHQLASGRIWTRAEHRAIVIFYAKISGLVEVWDTKYLADMKSQGKRLELSMRRCYQSVEQALATEIGY